MSLYYVMRPDNVNDADTIFVRSGRLSQSLPNTLRRAAKVKGRVIEVTPSGNVQVASFWEPPKPKPRLNSRDYRAARYEAALFA